MARSVHLRLDLHVLETSPEALEVRPVSQPPSSEGGIGAEPSTGSALKPIGVHALWRREMECLMWIGRGKTYHETAEILSLSFTSIKSYLDSARHKLDAVNLVHAIVVALHRGVFNYDQLLHAKVAG